MSRSDDERIADIIEAAGELAMVVQIGRDEFLVSVLHVRAAERLLEIIGEASNSLSDELKAGHGDIAWHDVVALSPARPPLPPHRSGPGVGDPHLVRA